jgi:hypothetical protein
MKGQAASLGGKDFFARIESMASGRVGKKRCFYLPPLLKWEGGRRRNDETKKEKTDDER